MIYASGICKSCEHAEWIGGIHQYRRCQIDAIKSADVALGGKTKIVDHQILIVKNCDEFLRYPGAEYPNG